LSRVVIISLLPDENVPNLELEAELRKHLESKSFSVDRITILSDTEVIEVPKLTN